MSAGKASQAGMVARQQPFLPALCHLRACEMTATRLHFVFTPQPGTRKMRGNDFLLLKFGLPFKERFLPKLGQTKVEKKKKNILQSRFWFCFFFSRLYFFILLTHSDSHKGSNTMSASALPLIER